jgi:hypothetical protein
MRTLTTAQARRKCHEGDKYDRECRYLIASPMGFACGLTSHPLRKKIEDGQAGKHGRGQRCANPYDETSEST